MSLIVGSSNNVTMRMKQSGRAAPIQSIMCRMRYLLESAMRPEGRRIPEERGGHPFVSTWRNNSDEVVSGGREYQCERRSLRGKSIQRKRRKGNRRQGKTPIDSEKGLLI